MRRFRPVMQTELGFEGAPMMIACLGVAGLVGTILLARYVHQDNKIESTKRHHPKGIGFTSMNAQKEHLRKITRKTSPNIDEHYYEYSRHNPLPHR